MAQFLRSSPEERQKCVVQAKEGLAVIDAKIESEKTTIKTKLDLIAKQESLIKDHKEQIEEATSIIEVLSSEVAAHRQALKEAEKDKETKTPKKEFMGEIAEDPDMYKYATFSTFEDIQKDTGLMSLKDVQDATPTHEAMDDLLGRLIPDGLEQFKDYKQSMGPIRLGHHDELSLRQTYLCNLLDITIFTDEEAVLADRKRMVQSFLNDDGDDNDENQQDEKPSSKKAKVG